MKLVLYFLGLSLFVADSEEENQNVEDPFHGKIFGFRGACSGGRFYLSQDVDDVIVTALQLGPCERWTVRRDFRTENDYNLISHCGTNKYLSIDHDHSVHAYYHGGHCQRFKITRDTRTENEWNIRGDCGKKWWLSIEHRWGKPFAPVRAYHRAGHCQRFHLEEVNLAQNEDSEPQEGEFDDVDDESDTEDIGCGLENLPAPVDYFHGKTFSLKGACSGGQRFLSLGVDDSVYTDDSIGPCERFLITRDFRTPRDYNLKSECGSKGYLSINHDHTVKAYHLGGHCQRFKITKDSRTEYEWNFQGDCGSKWWLSIRHDKSVGAYKINGHCQRFTLFEYNAKTGLSEPLSI